MASLPFVEALLRAIFPAACLACRRDLIARAADGVCRTCFRRFSAWRPEGVAIPVPFRAAVFYESPVRELLQAYKYGGKDYLADLFGAVLVDALPPSWGDVDAVVPVPTNFWRSWRRGYSPSGLLAAAVARRLGRPLSGGGLQRRWRMPAQTALSRERRLENAGRGFRRVERVAVPARILLIDDVCTTGATLVACSEALRGAGRVTVKCAAFAYDRPGRPRRGGTRASLTRYDASTIIPA